MSAPVTAEALKKRFAQYALRCAKLAEAMPRGPAGDTIGRQLVRAATSVAANYRAACRGRSKAEFIAKLGIVEEEADESLFWIEFAVDGEIVKDALVKDLLEEGREILAIIIASRKTAKRRKTQQR